MSFFVFKSTLPFKYKQMYVFTVFTLRFVQRRITNNTIFIVKPVIGEFLHAYVPLITEQLYDHELLIIIIKYFFFSKSSVYVNICHKSMSGDMHDRYLV